MSQATLSEADLGVDEITLFVDDKSNLLESIRRTLHEQIHFHSTMDSTTIENAWEILGVHNVRHVISDWKMGNEDGLEFLIEVRRCFPEIRCSLLTAFGSSLTEDQLSRLETANVHIWEKRNLNARKLAELVGYVEFLKMAMQESQTSDRDQEALNDEERLLHLQLENERLQSDIAAKRKIIGRFAADLLSDLKKIQVQKGGSVEGAESLTLDDILYDIENLTPRGQRWIELDRKVRRRFT